MRLFSARVKIRQIPHVNFETTSQFFFKFSIILQWKYTLILCKFLAPAFSTLDKRIPSMSQFWHFQVLWWKFAKLLMSFCKHKSDFLQILHQSSLSWKITPLYFFSSKITYFAQKEPVKFKFLRLLSAWVKIHQILIIFETTSSFSSNFASLFRVIRYNSSMLFQLKFYILSTKSAYDSTNSVKFHVTSQKFEILHFDGLLLSKSYTVLAKKVQKSYLSWHWRVMDRLKKNPTGSFKQDMRSLVNFHPTTQNSESFTSMSSFCPKYIRFELKNTSLMTLDSDAKFE